MAAPLDGQVREPDQLSFPYTPKIDLMEESWVTKAGRRVGSGVWP